MGTELLNWAVDLGVQNCMEMQIALNDGSGRCRFLQDIIASKIGKVAKVRKQVPRNTWVISSRLV